MSCWTIFFLKSSYPEVQLILPFPRRNTGTLLKDLWFAHLLPCRSATPLCFKMTKSHTCSHTFSRHQPLAGLPPQRSPSPPHIFGQERRPHPASHRPPLGGSSLLRDAPRPFPQRGPRCPHSSGSSWDRSPGSPDGKEREFKVATRAARPAPPTG